MTGTLGVALVGAGSWGELLGSQLALVERTSLLSVVDANAGRAPAVCRSLLGEGLRLAGRGSCRPYDPADVIVTCPHQVGGLFQVKKVAALVETAGLPLNRHAVGELGVGAIAGLHVMATIPNLMDGNQTHHQLLCDDVLADPVIRLDGGKLSPPTRPGLGIVLNEEKVEKYTRLYEQDGQYFNFPVEERHR